jgi:prophage antirepressor-like protein
MSGDNKETPAGALAPIEFTFENHAVRTFKKDDEIWFANPDVCEILELGNPRQVITRLDDDEKGVHQVDTSTGKKELNVINLAGPFRLILRSDRPQARAVQRWVIHEVLPAIYKTGQYASGIGPGEDAGLGGPGRSSSGPTAAEVEYAQRRFHEIYSSDFVNPDFLLNVLFSGQIPFTGHDKFRFFAREACEALGIADPEAAIERVPETQKSYLTVYANKETQEAAAITFLPRRPGSDKPALDCQIFALLFARFEALWAKLRPWRSPSDTVAAAVESTMRVAAELAQPYLNRSSF